MARPMDPIEKLPSLPASDVKRRGWRGVMRTLTEEGTVMVTNHNQPEAVIIAAKEYVRIAQIVKQVESRAESELEALRRRFDQRLAALQAPDAGARLRRVMGVPAKLRGKVKAGRSY